MPDNWHRHNAPPPVVGAVDTHLDERALTEPATNADHKHLADCLFCAHRASVANAARNDADIDVADLDAFDRALSSRLDADRPAVFATAALPAAVAAAVQAAPDVRDVEPAQLWRVSWQDMTALVVVVSTDNTSAVVAPATPDIDLADQHTLVVPGTGNGLDGPWAIWLTLARPVPLFVFDRYYAYLTLPGETRSVARVARDVIAAYKTGDPIDAASVGTAPSSELSVVKLADSLREQLSVFADAAPERSAATVSSDELERALDDLTPQQLSQTGLRRADLLRVVRGTDELNKREAVALAPVLGYDVDQLLAIGANVPDGLVGEAHKVQWRAARELWAEQENIDPVDAPIRLARSAYKLAARTDAGKTGSRWEALIRFALHDQLAQLSTES